MSLNKESQICPTCAVLMQFRDFNQILKCSICGYTVIVVKKVIKVLKDG